MSFDNTPEDVYNGMEEIRRHTSRAMRTALTRLYRRHFSGSEDVLEIGAGKRFMQCMIPPHSGKWIGLDSYRGGASFPCSVQADAGRLPFLNGTFDRVVGFESFNSFHGGLEGVVTESVRVLKRGGTFMCAYDFCPVPDFLGEDYSNRGLPVRRDVTFVHGLPSTRLMYIPEKNMAAYMAQADGNSGNDDITAIVKQMDETWEKFGKRVPPTAIVRQFNQMMADLLRSHFDSVKTGVETAFYCGSREDGQHEFNFHGQSDSELRYSLAYFRSVPTMAYHALRTASMLRMPCVEAAQIPYIVGSRRK